ncbi:MAG TPA: beta-propeller domain-containing protein, partial [Candidatus Hydrogenedentes bacterium]|nr:beta-propeller domain-containing protein [Candidatus Hydrogenedentota bacterium]
REVVEPDVIRRIGNLLYVLNQYRGLTIVNLDTNAILSQAPTIGYPRDLYVTGNRAYVLVGYAASYTNDNGKFTYDIASRVYVLDISDPTRVPIVASFDLDGDFVDSRMVGSVLYAVCARYEWYWEDVPGGTVTDDETAAGSNGPAIVKEQTSSSWVTSLDIADPNHPVEVNRLSLDGYGNIIQATADALFVAAPDNAYWYSSTTTIRYIDISDPHGQIAVRGAATVQGVVADRFKMDVYDNVLRVVSSAWNWQEGWRRVYITTINLADPDHLAKLGETQLDEASGETLFATRFDGPLAYIVTYLVVDPLFIVDLSNPAKPVVAGEIKAPGWSTHIEPRGDRLIALGVDDTDGRKVCVSLFDVSNPASASQLDRVTFGQNWAWSTAYSDVKAFTVLDDVLIVPFSGWEETGGYERLQFISYTRDTLSLRGYADLEGSIMRSFEYDPYYFGVTTEQLATIDASDLDHPEVIRRLTLAENVVDCFELNGGIRAEIISVSDTGRTRVRLLDAASAVLGETDADIGSFMKALPNGDSVVLVGTFYESRYDTLGGYSYEYYYLVATIDCTAPEAPVATVFKVDAQPYWGWYWYDWYMGGVEADKSIMPWWGYRWWYPQADSAFLLNGLLALRCGGQQFDETFGDETAPYQGIALVNLSTQAVHTIGFGYTGISSLNAAGSKLYLGTQKDAGAVAGTWMPICAHYLREIDPAAPSIGPAVNVPGLFEQFAAGILVTRDDQWGENWTFKSSLVTMPWDGRSPIREVADTLALPPGAGSVLPRGSAIYFTAYEAGTLLYAVAMDPAGKLALGDGLLLTDQWATLFEADAATAYVTIGNLVARYGFADGQGSLRDVAETMGYPTSVRFGAEHAYIALGYSGVHVLPR